jgi:hypothetical protein
MGKSTTTWRLAKGYWVFWIAVIMTAILVLFFQRVFRVDMYSHFDAYVISGLAVSGFLQVGWSAFAALVIHGSVTDTSIAGDVVLYAIGVLSGYVARRYRRGVLHGWHLQAVEFASCNAQLHCL